MHILTTEKEMQLAYLVIRIILLPLVLLWLLALCVPKALIWALDCRYDHDALLETDAKAVEWMRRLLHGA